MMPTRYFFMENPALMASCWKADVKGKERRRNLHYSDEGSRIEPLNRSSRREEAHFSMRSSECGTRNRARASSRRLLRFMGSLHDSRIAMNGGARTPSKARQVDPRPSVVIFSRPNPDLA